LTASPSGWRQQAAVLEALGGEVSRAEFLAGVDDELMAACGQAADAPRQANGAPSRAELLWKIRAELDVLWATLTRPLPPVPDAAMKAGSAAARAFHEAMVRLWTAATTWEIPKKSDCPEAERIGATKASLISRVVSQVRAWESINTDAVCSPWQKIHPAASAWWRSGAVAGELRTFLGMRWEVVATVKQELPGVVDQDSLTRLGRAAGVLLMTPPVPDRLDRGKQRLAVLSDELTDELMAVPIEETATG
jgi:hypothetical protein